MRLAGKSALVAGAGQTPGDTIGNGRAMSTLFAREGASVLCVDRVLARAEETVAAIEGEGGVASAFEADVTDASSCKAAVEAAVSRYGGLDILVNNVGIGAGGDGPAHVADDAAFDRILNVNLKGAWLMTKAAIPALRNRCGAIVNISSLASIAGATMIAYEVSKAAMNRMTLSVAASNAKHGVRCNAILPGFMDTPMAIATVSEARGVDPAKLREQRNAMVPLGGKMGDGWDTAYAALFLASDEAKFITGVLLPVDGGMSTRVG
ncbi:SDR family NAD(P)-dependent oxidoreductase [Terricaulis sp.]|uniref:SDR family NAD(P)-dependent oxidoreductase n=1 Tax=Terricaulis sp. TaxID=2768686 RepID=UPI0037831194